MSIPFEPTVRTATDLSRSKKIPCSDQQPNEVHLRPQSFWHVSFHWVGPTLLNPLLLPSPSSHPLGLGVSFSVLSKLGLALWHRRRRRRPAEAEMGRKGSYSALPSDYRLLEEVGYGASATVFRAIYLPSNEIVAVKCLDLDRCNSNLVPVFLFLCVLVLILLRFLWIYFSSFAWKFCLFFPLLGDVFSVFHGESGFFFMEASFYV